MSNSDTQVSLPSIAILLVLGGLVVRYLFFNSGSSSASTSAQSGASNPAAAMRRREEAVAQLQQMFPQLDRRTLLWDLQRTGGNMAATAERALAGRLDTVSLQKHLYASGHRSMLMLWNSHPSLSNHLRHLNPLLLKRPRERPHRQYKRRSRAHQI